MTALWPFAYVSNLHFSGNRLLGTSQERRSGKPQLCVHTHIMMQCWVLIGAACTQGGVEVRVGDFVELSPMAGDDCTRLVQVKALWSEPTQARQRMLARCLRFYRPAVLLLPHIYLKVTMHSDLLLMTLNLPPARMLSSCAKCFAVLGSKLLHLA